MNIVGFALDAIDKAVLPVLFTLSLALFVWGTLMYIIQGKYDEEVREKGKAIMVYGLLIFMIMFFLWGVVRILTN